MKKVPNCKCLNCKKEIYKKPYSLKTFSYHFCDRKCSNEYQKRTKGSHKEFNCDECGKRVIKNRNQRRSSKTGLCFCSNQCKNKYIANRNRWKKNPYSHRTRRPKLIEASNGKCQKCGYSDYKELLDIHHNDGNHDNNEWKNLRVLCVRCHNEFHRIGIQMDLPILISE